MPEQAPSSNTCKEKNAQEKSQQDPEFYYFHRIAFLLPVGMGRHYLQYGGRI